MAAFERLKRFWTDLRPGRSPDVEQKAALDRIERRLQLTLDTVRAGTVHSSPEERLEEPERRVEGMEVRLNRLEQRLNRFEQRLDALGRRQDAIQLEMRERFESVNDRFRTFTSKVEHLDGRLVAKLDRLEGQIEICALPVAHLRKRLEQVESASDQMHARVETLRSDLRQRLPVSSNG